jgi:hypothetical protein
MGAMKSTGCNYRFWGEPSASKLLKVSKLLSGATAEMAHAAKNCLHREWNIFY